MIVQIECDKFPCMNRKFQAWKNLSAVVLIVFLIFPSIIQAFADTSGGFRIRGSSYGFSLESESHGSALGGFYSFGVRSKLQVFLQGRILDVAGEAEYPVYDYYYGRWYKTKSSVNLFLLPLFGGLKFHPFEGKIANNFSPFLMCTAGPTVILDLPEGQGFIEQWKSLNTMFTIGGFIGIGIDFMIQSTTYASIVFGYDFLPMGREVDGHKDYSGNVIKFMIGRKRR